MNFKTELDFFLHYFGEVISTPFGDFSDKDRKRDTINNSQKDASRTARKPTAHRQKRHHRPACDPRTA